MQRNPVSSSDLAEVGYDAPTMTLEIAFHSGGVYQYFDVPESVYQALISADSVGRFFHANVRNSYRHARL